MKLTWLHLIGMILTLLLVFGIGVCSGRKVLTASDFAVSGRKAGSFLVMGTILGTLIGGASTVGTAQLAYVYGFSAWWFTLGGGLGCLVIALFLIDPLHKTSFETIPQFISFGYGKWAGMLAALFVSIGMFINIIPQIFSSMALLSSMFPLDPKLAAVITVMLAIIYVVFGGAWAAGLLGVSKIILTCLVMLVAGFAALMLAGGPQAIISHFPPFPWFSLFGRGVNTDLAAAFSLLVGVLSSQIYFQGIFSSRDRKAARGGALLSAVLAPLIGLGGILAGLYMKMHYPQINPALALPLFVINHLPPWFSGVVLAALLLAAIGTGAGLTLGVSTMLNRDIYLKLRPKTGDSEALKMFRLLIVFILALALVIVLFAGGEAMILNWSYLSLGLRGATICFPLLSVIFFQGRISKGAGLLSVVAGPLIVLAATFVKSSINPLYLGLAASFLILLTDLAFLKNKRQENILNE